MEPEVSAFYRNRSTFIVRGQNREVPEGNMGLKVPSLMVHTLKLFVYAVSFIILSATIMALFSNSKSNKRGSDWIDSKRRDYTQMELMDQVHRKQLRKIQFWFIETGFGEFYKSRDKAPIKEYVKNRGYHFRVEPSIDRHTTHKGKQYHTLARIVIQAKFIYNQLWCLEQVEHKGKIYEYWLMQEKARKGKYDYRDCEFMVSEADSKKGKRKIIHTAPQFFSEYKVSDDFTLFFPKKKLLDLSVNYYPECYQKTDMEEVKNILERLN